MHQSFFDPRKKHENIRFRGNNIFEYDLPFIGFEKKRPIQNL